MAAHIDHIPSLSDYTGQFQSKVKKFSGYADLRNMLGLLYYAQGKKAAALSQFSHALLINPLYEEAMVNRCFALFSKGQKKKALGELTAFQKKKKTLTHRYYLSLAILHYLNECPAQALFWSRKAVKKNSHDPYALIIAGLCCRASGKETDAKRFIKEARKMSYSPGEREQISRLGRSGEFSSHYFRNPFVRDLFVRISEELAKAQEMKNSWQLTDFALGRDFASSRMLNFLGLLALKNRRELEATGLFHRAFLRNCHNAYPAIHLFFIYGARGQYKKAGSILNEALRYNRDYADLHNYRGIFYDDLGKKSLAQKEYLKALEINPLYLDALYHAAGLYEERGKDILAFALYLRIARLRRLSKSLLDHICSLYLSASPASRRTMKRTLQGERKKKSGYTKNIVKISWILYE